MTKLNIINRLSTLNEILSNLEKGTSIGFVPTMGALHDGHGALIEKSLQENNFTIVSIFINPTQFNNSIDFENYPIQLEKDFEQLIKWGCKYVFTPTKEEIYSPDYIFPGIELGEIENTMEGKFRPGHFLGVCQIVYRLFQLIQPKNAYFGLKDFQQVAVIQHLVNNFNLPINIIPCPTLRESNGLAMSSRNLRLSIAQRNQASILHTALQTAKTAAEKSTPEATKELISKMITDGGLIVEYVEIVHPLTLQKLTKEWVNNSVACVVAVINEVRLIDNLEIYNKKT
jgi:pantoate--beta-alanine ligase